MDIPLWGTNPTTTISPDGEKRFNIVWKVFNVLTILHVDTIRYDEYHVSAAYDLGPKCCWFNARLDWSHPFLLRYNGRSRRGT